MNDCGLCIILGKLVSVQLRDSYFDEGISKCQGFSRNALGGGENMKEMLSLFQSGPHERKMSRVRFLKSDLFKRSLTTRP